MSQKPELFITTALRTSKPIYTYTVYRPWKSTVFKRRFITEPFLTSFFFSKHDPFPPWTVNNMWFFAEPWGHRKLQQEYRFQQPVDAFRVPRSAHSRLIIPIGISAIVYPFVTLPFVITKIQFSEKKSIWQRRKGRLRGGRYLSELPKSGTISSCDTHTHFDKTLGSIPVYYTLLIFESPGSLRGVRSREEGTARPYTEAAGDNRNSAFSGGHKFPFPQLCMQ
jgi:hypothetical protein